MVDPGFPRWEGVLTQKLHKFDKIGPRGWEHAPLAREYNLMCAHLSESEIGRIDTPIMGSNNPFETSK